MGPERTAGEKRPALDASSLRDTHAILETHERTRRAVSLHPPRPEKFEKKQAPELIPTPPLEDDGGYILTAFGDISLSNMDFVPGPIGVLSPPPDSKRRKAKAESPNKVTSSKYPVPLIMKRAPPPPPSKATIARPELSFEDMVMDLKSRRFREVQNRSPTPAEAPSAKLAPMLGVVCPQPRRLIDMKNLGREEVLSTVGSYDVVENNAQANKAAVEPRTSLEGEDLGAVLVPKHKQVPLRGRAKLPRRLPILRWDVDNVDGAQGKVLCQLGTSSRYSQLT